VPRPETEKPKTQEALDANPAWRRFFCYTSEFVR